MAKKTIKKTAARKKTAKKAAKINKKTLQLTKTNRAKVDPQTGQIISRRQYEKKYGRGTRKGNYNPRVYNHKLKLYKLVRDDYIEAEYKKCMEKYGAVKGKNKCRKLGKREAMNSPELKKIVRELKSKDPIKRAAALERTGRIDADQIEFYAQKFANED